MVCTMTINHDYSTIPSSGGIGTPEWPKEHVLPQGKHGSLSTGGWTADSKEDGNTGNEGFIQQTFLGASIRSFNINAGFGDTTSSLSIQLVFFYRQSLLGLFDRLSSYIS